MKTTKTKTKKTTTRKRRSKEEIAAEKAAKAALKAEREKAKIQKIIDERRHGTEKQMMTLIERMPYAEVCKFICELDDRVKALEKVVYGPR